MKKENYAFVFLLISNLIFAQTSGVGINESIPEQALHLGSSSGTIRIDGLNDSNDPYNGGGTNTYPLLVDNLGNLTLEFIPLYNSNGSDALDHLTLPSATITILNGDNDGIESGELFNFTINTNRASILEVKYDVSFEVFLNAAEIAISDKKARRINTYFRVNTGTRQYGVSSKCYNGGSVDSETGNYFNSCTSYINLPTSGTYTIRFYGEVSSGINRSNPNTGLATCVKFARGNDSLLFRLH
jgi:hypothetical protein